MTTDHPTTSVLLVEDDRNMCYLLQDNLFSNGYKVETCHDGKEGFRRFRETHFDLCILDIMLPRMDGFQLAAKIRLINETVPIIFLTSRSMEADKLLGFKTGCDDYITKPFSLMELNYRIQAVLKRSPKHTDQNGTYNFKLGIFEFDSRSRVLKSTGGQEKKLTPKESKLLRLLCEKKNELVTRSFILNHIWGDDDYFIARSMDVYLTRIRNLLKPDPTLEIINVYGTGYQLLEK
ncbi:response regulator transcription factor [soil metagenome]